MIPKDIFVNVMNSLMVQMSKDRQTEELLTEMYGKYHLIPDNSLLITSVIDLLSLYFDQEELIFYIFESNFGKENSESNLLSPEEFYDKLIKSSKNGRK
jgi:hypothetical protein